MRKQREPKSMNVGNGSKRSSQLLGPFKGHTKLCFLLEQLSPQDSSECACPAGAGKRSGPGVCRGLLRTLEEAYVEAAPTWNRAGAAHGGNRLVWERAWSA